MLSYFCKWSENEGEGEIKWHTSIEETVREKIKQTEIVDLRDICDQVETPFYDWTNQ